MPLQAHGNWRIVVELLSPRDDAGNPGQFTEEDRAAVAHAVPGSAVTIDGGSALRVAIIVGDRSAVAARELAEGALEQGLAASATHPQLWEIKIHTTAAYVTTKPA
jgi:hypothetical protein